MKRGLRFTVSISSTSFWNSNLSSMVATGNSPPYGVRFLPSKSNGVEPAILLGSGVTAGGPCLERVLPLCFFSFFTFWVTSWKSAREARTSLPLCFTTGFPGSPEGSLPQSLFSSSNAVHRSGNNNIDIGSKGCPLPCTESSTIRIGGDVGYGPQTATYIAGIYGNSPTGALPVVINASGQLGTTTSGIGVTSFNGRTGAVVPAANDYNFSQIAGTLSFSQLSGTLGGSQLSGTYTNQLAFNNTSNSFAGSFAGNGSGLTGVTSGLSWPIVLESADYAIQASDFSTPTTYGNYLILTGSAAHTFNLPNPAPPSGNCVAIGNMASAPIASNLNVFLTVSANGLTVDGSALVATQPKRNSYLYCSDGTNYWRLDRQLPGLSE